jgi:hypothetical protein
LQKSSNLLILASQRFRFSAFTHLAASNQITSGEISAQRLKLQRNGSPIPMDGSRYQRLAKTKPREKLEEALEMLKNF